MKKTIFFALIFSVIIPRLSAQTIIYDEDFEGAVTWDLDLDVGAPGYWDVSCDESGVGDGACSQNACFNGAVGFNTLHWENAPQIGARYYDGGPGPSDLAQSADISTIGSENLELNFDMIAGGNDLDTSNLVYSIDGGASWVVLDAKLEGMCCDGAGMEVPCDLSNTAVPTGFWKRYTYNLPASCEEINNLRIGFEWYMEADGDWSGLSIAVDNIEITSNPVVNLPIAEFTMSTSTIICAGDNITFTDMTSGGTAPYTYDWTFPGGAPAADITVGPHIVNFPTAGSYDVVLEITDAGMIVDDTTISITVVDCANPTASFTGATSICSGDDITFTDNSIGGTAPYTYNWTFDTGMPSAAATGGPHIVNFPTAGVYNITLEVTDAGLVVDDTIVVITVTDCSGPTGLVASFTPDLLTVCEGDCINMNDNSTGMGIVGWGWTFSDATLAATAGMDPGPICFLNAGDIDVTLTITDGIAVKDTTIRINVLPLPLVTPTASPNDTICEGEELTLTGSGADTHMWDMGVLDGTTFIPTVLGTTTYSLTGEDANGCINVTIIDVFVQECVPLIPGFEYSDNNCVDDCITLTDTSTGIIVEWNWDFGGAAEPNSSTEQNPTICFPTPGVYNIQLTLTDNRGEIESTTNSVSVFNLPIVTAELDTIIDLAGKADLLSNGSDPNGFYRWLPDDRVDCDTCQNTTASPFIDTDYIVYHIDVNGCISEDTVSVKVNFIEGIGVPSAFSPNADGLNDVLYVLGFGIETMRFIVYNKYGQQVFETTNQGIGWDGTFKQKNLNQGVFTWALEYSLINGSTGSQKGNTTLIR